MQNVHFTPPQLAKLFQVNESTIKRWVDRGLLQSSVTPGKHRRVSQKQLVTFIQKNKKFAKYSYVLRRFAKDEIDFASSARTLYDLLKRNQTTNARSEFQRLYVGAGLLPLLEEIITPVLQRIGAEWAKGDLTIYQEHQMSFLVRQFLVDIDRLIPEPEAKAPLAVLACAEGDRHEIPLQMLALLMKQHGVRSLILGTNIPIDQIIRASEDMKASYICLTRIYSPKQGFNYLKTLATYASMKKTYLFYGGNGWKKSLQEFKWKNSYASYVPKLGALSQILEKSEISES